MKIINIFCIIFVLTIFMAVEALASFSSGAAWAQPGNPFNTPYFDAYSMPQANLAANISNSSYSMCILPGGSFQPTVADFGNDNHYEVAVVNVNNSLALYDTDCRPLALQPGRFISNALITNYNGDSYLDLAVLTNDSLQLWDYRNGALTLQASIFVGGPLAEFTVYNTPTPTATACRPGYRDIDVFNLAALTVTNNMGQISAPAYCEDWANYQFKYADTSATSSNVLSDSSFGTAYSVECSPDWEYCWLFDQGGNHISSVLPTSYSRVWSTDFIERFGSLRYIFGSSGINHYTDTQAYIYDLAGNLQLMLSGTGGLAFSNWVVGDYNKDGQNEACIETTAAGATEQDFSCYNSAFIKILSFNASSCLGNNAYAGEIQPHIVMADFNPAEPTLGIASSRGVIYQDGAGCNIFYSTGLGASRFNSPAVVPDSVYHTPILAYFDGTNGFLLRDTGALSICGNSICDMGENEFNCYIDCNSNTTAPSAGFGLGATATNASDCASGYIEYGKCALRPGKYACSAWNQCVSRRCTGGFCDEPTLWDGLNNAKTEQFGNDTNSNNFISLFFMFGIGVGILILGRGAPAAVVGAGVTFVALAVFFTVVGWLSPWILVGVFLITLVVGIIMVMILRG